MDEHWQFEYMQPCWVNIYCPTLEDKDKSSTFKIRREIYNQFKELETKITDTFGLVGWVSHTKLENPHIMVFFSKIGAAPYYIDRKERKIWFKKFLKGV